MHHKKTSLKKVSPEEWSPKRELDQLPLLELPFSIEEVQQKLSITLDRYPVDGLGEFLGAAFKLDTQYLLINGPIEYAGTNAIVEMLGNEPKPKTLLTNLCNVFDLDKDDLPWVTELLSSPAFIVLRLDDNGNEVEMQRFHREGTASYYAQKYEERGHKQTYTVKKAI